MSISPLEQLDRLHASYVTAVNEAVAADNTAGVRRLAAAYDVDSARILHDSLGLEAPVSPPVTGVRRLVQRMHRQAA